MTSDRVFPNNRFGTQEFQSAVEIPLTKGRVALVDREDYERFGHLKWTAQFRKAGIVYAYRNERGPDGRLRNVYLHRAILEAPEGFLVDHINRNSLDCRRSNLRLADRKTNAYNRRYKSISQNGFIGVIRRGEQFAGRVTLERRCYYTKQFPSPILAAAARDVLAQRLHGEFAVLNFQTIPASVEAR